MAATGLASAGASDYALGLDFGTASVRALLVRCGDGAVAGTAAVGYPCGDDGLITDPAEPELARQDPRAWLDAVAGAVRQALAVAGAQGHEAIAGRVVGIGVDTTASTPLPVDAAGVSLAADPEVGGHPAALAWLWKDHTAAQAAADITALAAERRPDYLHRCGGAYSSEWFWAKILHCARTAPEVFERAHSWVECCDFVPAWLCGTPGPDRLARSLCAAGHKALYAADWGGLPDAEFLAALDPRLADLRGRLYAAALASDQRAGALAAGPARALGLPAGIPVAVGAIDAHLGALGAGIAAGDLVKVLGTSTCDMAIRPGDELPRIAGISGIAPSSIVPGAVGIEAGQAAVGDAYRLCAELLGGAGDARDLGVRLAELERQAAQVRCGSSGLLALDWVNGNRCVLADPELSGAVLGLTLHSTPGEVYRAFVEATAFGARTIVERIESAGVAVRRVIACGGIAQKSDLVLQVHADVLNRPLLVAGSGETCALGAAICGAVAGGRFADVESAQVAMCPPVAREVVPDPSAVPWAERLFALYGRVHDAFGGVGDGRSLGGLMKELRALRRAARVD